MRRTALICVALILVTIAAYEPVRSCGFLNFDDPLYVTNNPRVFRGLTADGFFWAWTTFHAANWHPLTWLSHMLDCEWFGDNPAAHHLVNLGIHTANVLLLFLGLKAMTGSMARSGWVAAFFALHPLHVESVAWISERKDVLSTLFWMLALLAYTRYAHARKPPRPAKPALKSAVGWYFLAYLAFAAGLLCKPMLVTLPFLLLLLDYWPLQRVPPGVFGSAKWSALLGEKIPFFALSIASSVVTYIAQSKGGAMATEETIPFLARLPNALVAYASYLLKMIWPRQLSVFYPHPIVWPVWTVIGAALLLVVVSILVVMRLRRRPYLLVGWLWYLGTLIPVIGLVQVGSQAMADRYSYVPLIGIFIMVVWTLAELVAQRSTALIALNCAAIVAWPTKGTGWRGVKYFTCMS